METFSKGREIDAVHVKMELVAVIERGQMKKYLGTVFSREKFRGAYVS